MGASYNAGSGNGWLVGDAVGWSRVKYAIPAAPVGTDQVIYVMRYWFDSYAANTNESGLTWPVSFYHGVKFDGTHVDTNRPVATEIGYDNFAGVAASNIADTAAFDDEHRINSGSSTVAGYYSTAGNGWSEFYNANGGDTGLASTVSPMSVPRDPTLGAVYTYVWRFYSSDLDDSVKYELWTNKDSIDLSTFNINTDLDPNDPKDMFPESAAANTGSLHGDVVGTNWRPSTGVMAFPTYFMFRYPAVGQKFVINYLGCQYASIGIA